MIAQRDEVVELAAALLLEGTRLDTGTLAARLGISRATLFRRVGNREALLGEALWHLAATTLRTLGAGVLAQAASAAVLQGCPGWRRSCAPSTARGSPGWACCSPR